MGKELALPHRNRLGKEGAGIGGKYYRLRELSEREAARRFDSYQIQRGK